MAIEYSLLRGIVLDHLRKLRPNEEPQVNFMGDNWVAREAQARGLHFKDEDGLRTLEVFHDLYREGVIVSGTSPNSSHAMAWPFYRVTEYGRTVLAQKEYVPHDPDGYLARLRSDIPAVDPTIIRYLEESLGCFKAGHMLASAVMLGCASEKAMLLLLHAFGEALADVAEQRRFKSVIDKQWMVRRKYVELWKALSGKLHKLPTDVSDDLHTLLDRVFDFIRTARNEAGHPTGKTIERDAMHAGLILFPVYCRRVFGLIAWFARNKI